MPLFMNFQVDNSNVLQLLEHWPSKPAIIFADEPTGNLDAKSSQEVIQLLKIAQRKYHETVIMVTHDEMIANVADRILRIEDGQIIQDTAQKKRMIV